MKILSAAAIRDWDQFTILHEPVSSLDLMERAAKACVDWMVQYFPGAASFGIYCGKGNNGGDGLAVARLLLEKNYTVSIYILEFGHLGTDDFQANLTRLHALPHPDIHFVQSPANFHSVPEDQIIIDALFGTGLNKKLNAVTAALVEHINNAGRKIISIDIPSGLYADQSSKETIAVKADYTLSFQCYKLALLVAENQVHFGQVHILDIGLHPDFQSATGNNFELIDVDVIRALYKPRQNFSHKGNFGHALLVCGSYGKMGAAVLSARACLRSGTGLLTCHVPASGYFILQTSVPEAMVTTDINTAVATKLEDDLVKFTAIGIGPGIGVASETKKLLQHVFKTYRHPMVVDADALNIIATQKELPVLIPEGSVLTPHPKEFERLFGKTANDFDSISLALEKADELNCIIVLKGHFSFIAIPGGKTILSGTRKGYFNPTGNAGMATAGSGDVLTGIITGLLAQGYSSEAAAVLGVYLHGLAGDIAAVKSSEEAIIASDIIENLGYAFKNISPV